MTKKHWIVTIMGGIILALAVALYSYANPRVGFTYYEPSYLPPNVSIKDRRIIEFKGNYTVDLNFRTEDWVYSIMQTEDIYPIESVNQNYDPTSVDPTCNFEQSPNGTSFRLCHWIDYGRIDVQEIKFVKDGTLIQVMIPSSMDQKINKSDIAKFVDSFEKKSTHWLPVLHSSGA